MSLVDELSWCLNAAGKHKPKRAVSVPVKQQVKALIPLIPFDKWFTNYEIAELSDVAMTDKKAYQLMRVAVKQGVMELKQLRIESVTINKYRRIK